MLKNEWKHLVKNKLMLVVVIAVITIPTIYTHAVPRLHVGSLWKRGSAARGGGEQRPAGGL